MNPIFRLYMLAILVSYFPLQAQHAKNAQQNFEQGENALNAGHYTEALEFFNKCLSFDPSFQEAYYLRAATKEQLEDLPGAQTDYSIFLEFKPEHTEALFSRGVLRFKIKLYELAREDFLKLLVLPPGETHSIFYRKTTFESGVNQIMTTQGAKDFVFNYLGLIETELKSYDQAIAYFDSALAINPKDPDYFVHRGLARESKGDKAGAKKDYEQASVLDPDHGLAQYNLGALARQEGNPDETEKYLTGAIDRNPDLPYPYQERAFFRMEKGDLKGALNDYNKALKIQSSDPESWLNRGLVKEKLRDFNGAFADFTQAIELKHNLERAWLSRGNVLSKMGKLKEAVEDYSVAITYWPEYTLAYYNRGIVYHRLGFLKEACADITKAQTLGMKLNSAIQNRICNNN